MFYAVTPNETSYETREEAPQVINEVPTLLMLTFIRYNYASVIIPHKIDREMYIYTCMLS